MTCFDDFNCLYWCALSADIVGAIYHLSV